MIRAALILGFAAAFVLPILEMAAKIQ